MNYVRAALDRVRSQLRRDAIKSGSKEPVKDEDIRKPRKPVSPEERKILDKIKQIEELQKKHESRKKVEK